MNYLDVYFSRINHNGDTTAERIRQGGIRSFEKWKNESPHTVRGLSVERGIYFDGIILISKDKSYEKIMFLNVSNDIPLLVGDIVNWILEDGSTEKWIILQEEKKVNGTYRTFWIVRCNYLLKWIDSQGHLQQSWSYLVSSVDSKIKGNFRTWNALITPQPNKYLEVLMPRWPIDRATNFIVEEESWTVVEYDHTSVPGVIYLSLTEGKINMIYDDIVNNIADIDKLAQYQFIVPPEDQNFTVGSEIQLTYTLMKNGIPTEAEVELLSQNKNVVKVINGVLTAVGEGDADIVMRLKDQPQVEQTIHIQVGGETVFSAYINGPDNIRVGQEAEYELVGSPEVEGNVTYNIDNLKLAYFVITNDKGKIIKQDSFSGKTCRIKANEDNELKPFVLTAIYNGIEYTKTIKIIPLW